VDAAALAPKPGAVVDADDVLQRLDKEVSSYRVPRRVLVLKEGEVPYLPSGKPDRLRIRTMLEVGGTEFRPLRRD
jgi:acyl-CoA synthetase (AMP-forming)/AMP-acid ligase II